MFVCVRGPFFVSTLIRTLCFRLTHRAYVSLRMCCSVLSDGIGKLAEAIKPTVEDTTHAAQDTTTPHADDSGSDSDYSESDESEDEFDFVIHTSSSSSSMLAGESGMHDGVCVHANVCEVTVFVCPCVSYVVPLYVCMDVTFTCVHACVTVRTDPAAGGGSGLSRVPSNSTMESDPARANTDNVSAQQTNE